MSNKIWYYFKKRQTSSCQQSTKKIPMVSFRIWLTTLIDQSNSFSPWTSATGQRRSPKSNSSRRAFENRYRVPGTPRPLDSFTVSYRSTPEGNGRASPRIRPPKWDQVRNWNPPKPNARQTATEPHRRSARQLQFLVMRSRCVLLEHLQLGSDKRGYDLDLEKTNPTPNASSPQTGSPALCQMPEQPLPRSMPGIRRADRERPGRVGIVEQPLLWLFWISAPGPSLKAPEILRYPGLWAKSSAPWGISGSKGASLPARDP